MSDCLSCLNRLNPFRKTNEELPLLEVVKEAKNPYMKKVSKLIVMWVYGSQAYHFIFGDCQK